MPQQFIERAKQAIEKAKKANASKFARDELTQAESACTTALHQLNLHNEFEAKSFAIWADDRAKVALKIARAKQTERS
jgi:hypothetical protein